MEIKTYEPTDPILRKYIQFYYELELNDEAYYAFPSESNVVCLFNNATVTYSANKVFIQENKSKSNSSNFIALNKFTKPLFVKSEGVVKEFVIIFKPHGLSQFINTNKTRLPFFEIDEFNNFKAENKLFFSLEIEDKIKIIEPFLLSNINEKNGLDIISKGLDLMKKDKLTIKEIANECNCSYKKLYRLFLIHCGTTPMIMKKNIRFRNVLQKIEHKDVDFKLSDIAFDLGYYDQAFFNKAFKKLTGETPKQFFKNVTVLSKKDIYFKNIK